MRYRPHFEAAGPPCVYSIRALEAPENWDRRSPPEPQEREKIPRSVMLELARRLEKEISADTTAERERICRGSLLSKTRYRTDIEKWGYKDARLVPIGSMTAEEIEHWSDF